LRLTSAILASESRPIVCLKITLATRMQTLCVVHYRQGWPVAFFRFAGERTLHFVLGRVWVRIAWLGLKTSKHFKRNLISKMILGKG
jgi:hypothetical protein